MLSVCNIVILHLFASLPHNVFLFLVHCSMYYLFLLVLCGLPSMFQSRLVNTNFYKWMNESNLFQTCICLKHYIKACWQQTYVFYLSILLHHLQGWITWQAYCACKSFICFFIHHFKLFETSFIKPKLNAQKVCHVTIWDSDEIQNQFCYPTRACCMTAFISRYNFLVFQFQLITSMPYRMSVFNTFNHHTRFIYSYYCIDRQTINKGQVLPCCLSKIVDVCTTPRGKTILVTTIFMLEP